MKDENWDDLRIFLGVYRAHSMRQAAERLGINHTTVSRRLQALEQRLNIRLFDRVQTGYQPTPEAEELARRVEQAETEIHAAERSLLGAESELRGEIRVTLPDLLATHFYMPAFASFCQAHPEIELELLPSYETFNLTRREADVAIRVTNQPPEHLVGRKLGCVYKASYVRKDLLGEIDNLNWIGWDDVTPHPAWVRATAYSENPARHRLNHQFLQVNAAKAGMGIAMLACLVGDAEPDLVRIPDPGLPAPILDLWLLTHPDLRGTARIKALLKHLGGFTTEFAHRLTGQEKE